MTVIHLRETIPIACADPSSEARLQELIDERNELARCLSAALVQLSRVHSGLQATRNIDALFERAEKLIG